MAVNSDKPNVPKVIVMVLAAIFAPLLLIMGLWDLFFWLIDMSC